MTFTSHNSSTAHDKPGGTQFVELVYNLMGLLFNVVDGTQSQQLIRADVYFGSPQTHSSMMMIQACCDC
jgi:hypothetical protein